MTYNLHKIHYKYIHVIYKYIGKYIHTYVINKYWIPVILIGYVLNIFKIMDKYLRLNKYTKYVKCIKNINVTG